MTKLSTVLLLLATPLAAHDTITTKLTWTREIQRIFIRRCLSCHQAGGPAPFLLSSWKEARPWAVAIREEVTSRRMPPVSHVKGFGEFRDDPALTQEEIQLITDWANGGAPEGDPRLESGELPRLWSSGSQPAGVPIKVSGELDIEQSQRLTGLQFGELAAGVSLQAILERPDGSIEPLAWIRDFRPQWSRPLVFLKPVEAPAGSRVRLLGPDGVTAVIFGEREPAP